MKESLLTIFFTFLKTSITVTHLRNKPTSRTEITPFTMFQKFNHNLTAGMYLQL